MSEIFIRNLRVDTYIGVPEEERAERQELLVDVILQPEKRFGEMSDTIENTVDYVNVCEVVKRLAMERPRRLIETLAFEIGEQLFSDFRLQSVQIEIRKRILPNTDFVGVRYSKRSGDRVG